MQFVHCNMTRTFDQKALSHILNFTAYTSFFYLFFFIFNLTKSMKNYRECYTSNINLYPSFKSRKKCHVWNDRRKCLSNKCSVFILHNVYLYIFTYLNLLWTTIRKTRLMSTIIAPYHYNITTFPTYELCIHVLSVIVCVINHIRINIIVTGTANNSRRER